MVVRDNRQGLYSSLTLGVLTLLYLVSGDWWRGLMSAIRSYRFTGQLRSWDGKTTYCNWPGFCLLSVPRRGVFIQMAELTAPFLMIFVNVKWTGWTIEMSRHGKSSDIFLNWKWPEKLEENKVNVNLTKIVNDYENIPTSDTSSNMLYLDID